MAKILVVGQGYEFEDEKGRTIKVQTYSFGNVEVNWHL